MLTDGMTQAASRSMPSRQAGFAAEKHRARLDDKGIDPRFEHRPKCIFEVLRTMHTHNLQGYPKSFGCRFGFVLSKHAGGIAEIHQSGNAGEVWDYFLEKLQPLWR